MIVGVVDNIEFYTRKRVIERLNLTAIDKCEQAHILNSITFDIIEQVGFIVFARYGLHNTHFIEQLP